MSCRTADGYYYYPEGEVGYPVCVPARPVPACQIEVTSVREHQGDTRDTERAEEPREKVERSELQEPTLEEKRRSSINIYQGQSKPLSHTAIVTFDGGGGQIQKFQTFYDAFF